MREGGIALQDEKTFKRKNPRRRDGILAVIYGKAGASAAMGWWI